MGDYGRGIKKDPQEQQIGVKNHYSVSDEGDQKSCKGMASDENKKRRKRLYISHLLFDGFETRLSDR